MAAPPLTHHDIVALVEPFTRLGRHVDLTASQRLERRLVFRPVTHAASAAGEPEISDTLRLDGYAGGSWRLTRSVEACGLRATLEAVGREPGDLLSRVLAVPPQRHFRSGSCWAMACSYELEAAGAEPVLTRGEVSTDGLVLSLLVPASRRGAGSLALVPRAAPEGSAVLELPEDLLAVLGGHWARLVREKSTWTSKLRLRGSAGVRTARAEAALQRAAAHLAQTLAEPPARFHERHAAARRMVVLRRAIPLLTAVGLIAALALLPRLPFDNKPGLWMLLYHLPTALIALSFCTHELARFEIPPWPRRSTAASWWRSAPVAAAASKAATAGEIRTAR